MSITRRLFLRHTAVAGVGASIAAPAVAEPVLSPERRIDAALEEIIAAYREKYPNCPIRIDDCDNIDNGMLIIVTHMNRYKPGEIRWNRRGLARRAS